MFRNKSLAAALCLSISTALVAPAAMAQSNPPQKKIILQEDQKGHDQKAKPSQGQQAQKQQHDQKKKPGKQASAKPDWKKKGGKMPQGQRNANKVDYSKHNLKKPPQGYQWVRNGDDYVLVAVASGIIASVIAATR